MEIDKTGRTIRMELLFKPEIKAKYLAIKKHMQQNRTYYFWGKYSNNDVIEKLVLDHGRNRAINELIERLIKESDDVVSVEQASDYIIEMVFGNPNNK